MSMKEEILESNAASESTHDSIAPSGSPPPSGTGSQPSLQRLLDYHEIPAWQQENEYLLSGYRATADSTLDCLLSCFRWHNETINIASHVVGSVLFAALPWHFYGFVYVNIPQALPVDLALFTVYLLGVSTCFACSAGCHVLWSHSPAIASLGNRLDYAGIVLLMWTACLPMIYYGFICEPAMRNLHWFFISTAAGRCLVVTLRAQFSSPQSRSYRTSHFTSFGSFALLSVVHGMVLDDFFVQARRMALGWMALTVLLDLCGAAAYAVRIPERHFPRRYDILGASHQILHVMVIVAGITHYAGLVQALREVRQAAQVCT